LPPEFQPLFHNPHLLTLAANFWPRQIDETAFPPRRTEYKIDPQTTVVALEHQPATPTRGQIVFLHGLEGSASSGYILSFAQEALTRGFGVHRLNMRTCGGTENLCETMYHSGLTSDTKLICERLPTRYPGPLFLVGFSLGGNVALKLAGELGSSDLITAVCAISTPLDLAACVRTIDKPSNTLYSRRSSPASAIAFASRAGKRPISTPPPASIPSNPSGNSMTVSPRPYLASAPPLTTTPPNPPKTSCMPSASQAWSSPRKTTRSSPSKSIVTLPLRKTRPSLCSPPHRVAISAFSRDTNHASGSTKLR
jgi:pimeloyl-ACP methyl ester carboxylesterase